MQPEKDSDDPIRALEALAASTAPPTARARLRSYFLTGVIIGGPLTITLYVTWWFIDWVDRWVKPLIPSAYLPESYLPFAIPGFGLIVAFLGLTLLGFLTAGLIGRTLITISERLLHRMPVVRGLYKGMKQIFETIFSQSGTSFRTVGIVEFPSPGMWSIVFISTPPAAEIAGGMPGPEEHLGVFLPCTPNPTTGFFFYVPRSRVVELPITVDEGAKLVMSAGLIQPDARAKQLKAMAEAARSDATSVA